MDIALARQQHYTSGSATVDDTRNYSKVLRDIKETERGLRHLDRETAQRFLTLRREFDELLFARAEKEKEYEQAIDGLTAALEEAREEISNLHDMVSELGGLVIKLKLKVFGVNLETGDALAARTDNRVNLDAETWDELYRARAPT